MKAVADALGVARSNLVEQLAGNAKSRGRYRRQGDDELSATLPGPRARGYGRHTGVQPALVVGADTCRAVMLGRLPTARMVIAIIEVCSGRNGSWPTTGQTPRRRARHAPRGSFGREYSPFGHGGGSSLAMMIWRLVWRPITPLAGGHARAPAASAL